MHEKPLPHSPEAERTILAALMTDNTLAGRARTLVKPDAFYVNLHRRAFIAALELEERATEINCITVIDVMREAGTYQEGDTVAVSGLTYGMPLLSSIDTYCETVNERAKLRWEMHLAAETVRRAGEPDADPAQVLAWLDEKVSLARGRMDRKKEGFRPASEIVKDVLLDYEANYHNTQPTDVLPTGFGAIDKHLTGGGLLKPGLHYIAARPSQGKTALARDIGVNVAKRGGHVLFLSCETTDKSIVKMIHAAESGVDRWKMRAGMFRSDYDRLLATADDVARLPISIDDSTFEMTDLRARVREAAKRMPIEVLIVDYLQLMKFSDDDRRAFASRNFEVGEISTSLARLAKEFDIPVIALSQLSRDCEKQGREPELSDLRDSGQIEQDAQTIFFLFGDKNGENTPYAEKTIKCGKQKEGPLFRVTLPFNGPLVTFRTFSQITRGGDEYQVEYEGAM